MEREWLGVKGEREKEMKSTHIPNSSQAAAHTHTIFLCLGTCR